MILPSPFTLLTNNYAKFMDFKRIGMYTIYNSLIRIVVRLRLRNSAKLIIVCSSRSFAAAAPALAAPGQAAPGKAAPDPEAWNRRRGVENVKICS
jgi:hypothetical protein